MSSPFDLASHCFSEEEEEVPSVPTSSIGIPPSEMHGEKREWTVLTRPDGTATMSTFDASKYVFYKQNPKQCFSILVPKEKAPRYSGASVVVGAYGKVIQAQIHITLYKSYPLAAPSLSSISLKTTVLSLL